MKTVRVVNEVGGREPQFNPAVQAVAPYEAYLTEEREILLVDDGSQFFMAIGEMLQSLGYQVYFAPDAQTALEELPNYDFDLVIAKVGQDSGEGLGVLQKAKQLHSHTRVMVIQGDTRGAFPLEAYRMKVDEYLLRPWGLAELFRRVAMCLKSYHKKHFTPVYCTGCGAPHRAKIRLPRGAINS